jgi:hypothetical protein
VYATASELGTRSDELQYPLQAKLAAVTEARDPSYYAEQVYRKIKTIYLHKVRSFRDDLFLHSAGPYF